MRKWTPNSCLKRQNFIPDAKSVISKKPYKGGGTHPLGSLKVKHSSALIFVYRPSSLSYSCVQCNAWDCAYIKKPKSLNNLAFGLPRGRWYAPPKGFSMSNFLLLE